MSPTEHFSHGFHGVGVGDGSQARYEVVDGLPVVGQQPHTVEREITRVTNKRGGVVVVLDVLFKGGLGLSGPNRIVVAGEHQAFNPVRKQFQQACEFGVLRKQIWNGELFFLVGVNPHAVHTIP